MRLRFWRRRPKRYILTKPSGLLTGDVLYTSLPRNVTPPAGWTWDEENGGWYRVVTGEEPISFVFTPKDPR